MKPKDVVIPKEGEWVWYGRIWKFTGPDTVMVINTNEDIKEYKLEDLEEVDYKGWYKNGRFIRMPSMRKLKARLNKRYGTDKNMR